MCESCTAVSAIYAAAYLMLPGPAKYQRSLKGAGMLKRTFVLLPVAIALACSMLAGCDDKKNTTANTPEQKVLQVGTNPTFAPFEFQEKIKPN